MKSYLSKYLLYYPTTMLKGEQVFKYLKEYRQFQYYSAESICSYQLKALKSLIKYASARSPYYNKKFGEAGLFASDISTIDDIKKFPQLTKELLVKHREEIQTTRNNPFITRKTTGGSTGQAVTLLKNPDALARERAATARAYEWAGVEIGDPQARFWGVPLEHSVKLKARIIDFIANRRRYSAFAVNPAVLQQYYEDILSFRPKYLYGYASSIMEFSIFLTDSGYRLPGSVKSVITTSEVLTDETRDKIQSATNARVFNEYGCGEVGSIAHECEEGSMHVMEDNMIVEIEGATGNNVEGEIILTDLFNYATPLIRYRVGDYASLGNSGCACGRSLKTFRNVHGRAYDCLKSPDGKIFHPELIMYIFEDIKNKTGDIRQFQVIQDKQDHLLIRLVPENSIQSLTRNIIIQYIHEKLHPSIQITFECVDHIEREGSGKMRLVKSCL